MRKFETGDIVSTKESKEAYYSRYGGLPEQWFNPGDLGIFIATVPSVREHPLNPSQTLYIVDFYGVPYGKCGSTIWRVALWRDQIRRATTKEIKTG